MSTTEQIAAPTAAPAADDTAAHARAWMFLMIASVFEVVFALATNATHGFTQLVPSIITILAAAGGIFTLSLALKTLDVGVGYTVWTGIGSVGTVVFGTLLFHEHITPVKILCFIAIIGGVVGLRLASRAS
jgi:quaternary ammonium compound-resistance protein SugE